MMVVGEEIFTNQILPHILRFKDKQIVNKCFQSGHLYSHQQA